MWTKVDIRPVIVALAIATPGAALSQDSSETPPLWAIPWLSESVREDDEQPAHEEPPPTAWLPTVTPIVETPLEGVRRDAVGLLAPETSRLPLSMWQGSASSELEDLVRVQRIDMVPAAHELLYRILLAEAIPPVDAQPDSALFLARIDKLLELGALEQAEALLERAGPTDPPTFRRWFDISLLTGYESRACTAIEGSPSLAPTYSARVYCLIRQGKWRAAAVTITAAIATGRIEPTDARLLALFLNPELIESQEIPDPERLTPLAFRMRESVGVRHSAATLPLAFAYYYLSGAAGYRAKVTAAELLARTSAIPPSVLISAYLERPPPSSGGVLDRARIVQEFDLAVLAANEKRIEELLPAALGAMKQGGLAIPFARYFGPRIARFTNLDKAQSEVFEVAILSRDFESAVVTLSPSTRRERFLRRIAQGRPAAELAHNPFEESVALALSTPAPEGQLVDSVGEGKIGEALLSALIELGEPGHADPVGTIEALSAIRAAGLDLQAREIGLQVIVTDSLY